MPLLKQNQWAYTVGLTAPVGIAVSWGNLCNWKREHTSCFCLNKKKTQAVGGKSLTIFLSLIDVDSVASYMIANDSSKVTSEFKLSNIISPGLFVYSGLGKLPVYIGLGGQFGPQLRSILFLSHLSVILPLKLNSLLTTD